MIDLLLERIRSLTRRRSRNLTTVKPLDSVQSFSSMIFSPEVEAQRDAAYLRPRLGFGFSPELQAQIDAIPDMVRHEDGDRGYPDSFYRPLRKDLNPDRCPPSCDNCYYYIGAGHDLKCAVNPTGTAATCDHFKPR